MAIAIEEILDIFLPSDQPSFVVNTAVNEVAIVPSANNDPPLSGRDQLTGFPIANFIPIDNVLILGAGVTLPFCFDVSTENLVLQLWWFDVTGIIGPFPAAELIIPNANQEIPLNIFSPWGGGGVNSPDNAHLCAYIINGKISMINAPAALNGSTQHLRPWVRIKHNLQLSA